MSNNLISVSDVEKQKGGTLRVWLDKPEIVADIGNSLSGWMDPEEFKSQIIVSMNDDKLKQCSPQSKYAAVMKCAALQLLPGLNQVALIPRKVKQGGQVVRIDVDVMPQWQGYRDMMMRNPEVRDITAVLVHPDDSFIYNQATGQVAEHLFDPLDEHREFKDFNDVRGGFVRIEWRDRTRPDKFHFVKKSTIMKARGCAQTGDVWNNWFEEQCLKTLYRNAYARRVVSVDPAQQKRLEELIRHEDQLLGNNPLRAAQQEQAKLTTFGPSAPAAPASRAQQMADRYTAPSGPVDLPNEAEGGTEPEEPETDQAADEAPEPDAQAEPAQEETKPKPKPKPSSKKKGGKKGQQSLIDEDDRTICKRLLDRIAEATSDQDLMVISDEASEWSGQGKLTTEEYEQIHEAVNQRQSEI